MAPLYARVYRICRDRNLPIIDSSMTWLIELQLLTLGVFAIYLAVAHILQHQLSLIRLRVLLLQCKCIRGEFGVQHDAMLYFFAAEALPHAEPEANEDHTTTARKECEEEPLKTAKVADPCFSLEVDVTFRGIGPVFEFKTGCLVFTLKMHTNYQLLRVLQFVYFSNDNFGT